MKSQNLYRWLAVLLTVALLSACANRGAGPQGGPKDEKPPVFNYSEPSIRSVNVDTLTDEINLYFNELIAIKDAYKHVMMSPPLKSKPGVKAIGKRVKVELTDTLKPNATYTLYFGDAITDNNEGNPLKNFVYTFSTGSTIDSCYIDGYVIDAASLAPQADMVAGIYFNAADTSFISAPFDRVAKTDAAGRFSIMNIPPGDYTIYALNDAASTWYYSQKSGGQIAFLPHTVSAKCYSKPAVAEADTSAVLKVLNHKRDSLAAQKAIEEALVLRMFKENPTREYFKKATRPGKEKFTLVFGNKPSMTPKLRVIKGSMAEGGDSAVVIPEFPVNEGWIMEKPIREDSLTYWLTDTVLLKLDTLKMEMTYLSTDTLDQLVEKTDTLNLVTPKKRTVNVKKKKGEAEKTKQVFLEIKHNINGTLEAPDTITLEFNEPIRTIVYDSIKLSIQVDTLLNPVPIRFETGDSLCNKTLKVLFEKEFGATYKINLDSACIVSMYGKVNDKFFKKFELKKLEQYSNLYITFKENPENAILELMNSSEKVLYKSVLEDGEVSFQDVTPGKYFLRMIIDENRNGKWDTGEFKSGTEPEPIYYFPKEINLPANWDVEQEWDYKSFPILQQRPSELKGGGSQTKSRQNALR